MPAALAARPATRARPGRRSVLRAVLGARSRKGAVLAAVCLLAVLATALAWPAPRGADPPRTRVLSVSIDPATGPESVGSGFVVGPGRAVTVAHLVDRRSRVDVRTPAGRARRGRLLRVDRRSDLALLAVPGLRGRRLQTAEAGDEVRLLLLREAGPLAMQARVRRTIDAHVRAGPGARPHTRPALELDARIAAGDSGAPVVAAGGEVAGVLFARSREHAGTAYAVDATAVERLVRRRGPGRPEMAR